MHQHADRNRKTVLLVDDDVRLRERMARALRDYGYDVRSAGSYDLALAAACADTPEYALVELRMPGRSGLELIRDLSRLGPSTRIVVLSGIGSVAIVVDAVRLGAVQFLNKPASAIQVVAAFERADQPPRTKVEEYAVPSLARAEWDHIHRVLHDCDGNISEAARRLALHRRSLQRKIRRGPPP